MGIAAWARAQPQKTAIAFGARRISYGELDARANRCARLLQSHGVQAGDRVAIALRNRPEFLEIAAAAARLRAEIVPVSWRFKRDEMRYMLDDSAARIAFVEDDAPIGSHDEGAPLIPLGAYEEALRAHSAAPAGEDLPPSFRYYTSGTSGRPKAVERPKADPAGAAARAAALPTMAGLTGPGEVHLACGPLYHTAPCAFANYALLFGHTVVLMQSFDARDALRAIQDERVTWTHMVPINFIRILDVRERFDCSSLKRVLHAAAPCPVDVKRRIMDRFPPGVVLEYYGMTEGLATMIDADEWVRKPGSVGRAIPGARLTIRDATGAVLAPGETGVVYVTGARFEYAGAPEKTAEAWRGDEFTVGDMGTLDADGYLYLTDRAQDMIITGGANVYPAEVEAVLLQHEGVRDCAVIGVPDDEFGEAVHAIVEGDAPDLVEFARARLAHYKCPRTVSFVDELPRDPTGTVRKRELREPYWEGRATRI
jgi:long-chain acyl-CoA synthetase